MNRDKNIDNLRGLAMFSMVVIHATAYFLKDSIAYFIWDFNQFSVPVFIFCSSYLFYSRLFKGDKKSLVSYFKKRFSRLFIPYWIFLLFYFPVAYFLGGKKINPGTVSSNIFLTGGLDLNWLVLLFLYLAFLYPIIYYLKNKKIWFYFLAGLSFISSIFFIFFKTNYRLIMWLPWSLVIFFSLFFIKNEKNQKKLFIVGSFSLLVFFIVRLIEVKIHHPLNHYDNKYPPTLYQLSYGVFWTVILYLFSVKKVFRFLYFDRLLHFLSINSYEIFFIHNLVIFVLVWIKTRFNHWSVFFLTILLLSIIIQLIINRLKIYLQSFPRGKYRGQNDRMRQF
jgi:peptidoglycan/LPS O-acetylase OafA/YrhL